MKNSVKFSKNIAVINTAHEEMIANAKRFRDKMDVFGETNGLTLEQLGLTTVYRESYELLRYKRGELAMEEIDYKQAQDVPYYLDDVIRGLEYKKKGFENGEELLLRQRQKEGMDAVFRALHTLFVSVDVYITELRKFSEVLSSVPLALTIKEMKRLALIDLKNRKYTPDSMWEGERTWLGIYARPIGTPSHGLDCDYSDWFEWEMSDLLELQRKYPL